MKRGSRVWTAVGVGLVASAVAEQLGRPAGERNWHGRVAGVPYDFRAPSVERFQQAWWNPDNPRVVTARDFGLGWALNVGRLSRLARERCAR